MPEQDELVIGDRVRINETFMEYDNAVWIRAMVGLTGTFSHHDQDYLSILLDNPPYGLGGTDILCLRSELDLLDRNTVEEREALEAFISGLGFSENDR
jgi:hypothetical protein